MNSMINAIPDIITGKGIDTNNRETIDFINNSKRKGANRKAHKIRIKYIIQKNSIL